MTIFIEQVNVNFQKKKKKIMYMRKTLFFFCKIQFYIFLKLKKIRDSHVSTAYVTRCLLVPLIRVCNKCVHLTLYCTLWQITKHWQLSYKSYAVIFRWLLLTLTFWMIGKMTQEGKTQILTLHEACIAWKEILEHTSQSKTVISGLPKKARSLPLGQTPPLAPVSGCPRKTTPATDKLKEARS